METKIPWYKQPAIIILLLVLFFPLGLILMWLNTNWTKQVKIIITAFFILAYILGSTYDSKDSEGVKKPQEATKPTVVEIKATPTPTVTEKDTSVTNEDVLYFDGVMSLLNTLTKANDHVSKVGELGEQKKFDKALEEIKTAEIYFDKADKDFKKLTPTKRFNKLNSILGEMLENYNTAIRFYVEGTEDLNVTSMEEGIKYYQTGNEKLVEAREEVDTISKEFKK